MIEGDWGVSGTLMALFVYTVVGFPILGVMVGAITAFLMPRTSQERVGLGALLGFGLAALGLVITTLGLGLGWASVDTQAPSVLGVVSIWGPPTVGALAPAVILPWRRRYQRRTR